MMVLGHTAPECRKGAGHISRVQNLERGSTTGKRSKASNGHRHLSWKMSSIFLWGVLGVADFLCVLLRNQFCWIYPAIWTFSWLCNNPESALTGQRASTTASCLFPSHLFAVLALFLGRNPGLLRKYSSSFPPSNNLWISTFSSCQLQSGCQRTTCRVNRFLFASLLGSLMLRPPQVACQNQHELHLTSGLCGNNLLKGSCQSSNRVSWPTSCPISEYAHLFPFCCLLSELACLTTESTWTVTVRRTAHCRLLFCFPSLWRENTLIFVLSLTFSCLFQNYRVEERSYNHGFILQTAKPS